MKLKVVELIKFLDLRPSLSARQIGIEAGYADGKYFREYLSLQRSEKEIHPEEMVPEAMAKKLMPILIKYGYLVKYNKVHVINPIKKKKIEDCAFVGIVLAGDYFSEYYKENMMPISIQPGDFVVCLYSDFHDGLNSHIEGATMVAILKDMDDAELIFRLTDKHEAVKNA